MELSPCPIFVDAEQCRSRINALSYGLVASADISQLPFVVISVIFLAMEQGLEENVIIVIPEHSVLQYTFSREGYPPACNPLVGMPHATSSPQQINGISILSTPARQVRQPDLVDLMSLFIEWGLTIQKRKWFDRAGYR